LAKKEQRDITLIFTLFEQCCQLALVLVETSRLYPSFECPHIRSVRATTFKTWLLFLCGVRPKCW